MSTASSSTLVLAGYCYTTTLGVPGKKRVFLTGSIPVQIQSYKHSWMDYVDFHDGSDRIIIENPSRLIDYWGVFDLCPGTSEDPLVEFSAEAMRVQPHGCYDAAAAIERTTVARLKIQIVVTEDDEEEEEEVR